jgi:hypothetical protein
LNLRIKTFGVKSPLNLQPPPSPPTTPYASLTMSVNQQLNELHAKRERADREIARLEEEERLRKEKERVMAEAREQDRQEKVEKARKREEQTTLKKAKEAKEAKEAAKAKPCEATATQEDSDSDQPVPAPARSRRHWRNL